MLVLRRARQTDVPEVERLVAAAYSPYVPRIGRAPRPMLDDYHDVLAGPEAWVALLRERIVGLLVLQPEEDHVYLDNVAVHPSAQKQGIGAALLAFAEQRAREYGLAELRLLTNEAMRENLSYYVTHGYLETHRAEEHGFRRVFFRKVVATAGDEPAGASGRSADWEVLPEY